MIVYLLMLMISIFFASFIKRKKSINDKVAIVLSAIPFFIVSAIRYDVGTDYMFRYTRDYMHILANIKVDDLEIGFKFLYKICVFTKSSQSIFIITSLITTYFIFKSIYRNSKNIKLSILLYFIGAYFFQSLNITREYMSISLCFFSYKYLIDEKYIKWTIFSILALSFHNISIVFIFLSLMVYIYNKFFGKSKWILNYKYAVLTIIFIFVFGPIIKNSIFSFISFTRFSVYIDSQYDYGDLQIISFIINSFVYIFILYAFNQKENLNNEDKFYICIQFLGVIFIAIGRYIYLSNRVSYYFTIFQILSIPYALSILKNKIKFKNYKLLKSLIIISYVLSISWTHIIHNNDEILPYKSIFFENRESIIY